MADGGAVDWASLPVECLRRALAAAVAREGASALAAAACVCTAWRAAACDEALWRAAFAAERAPSGGVRAASARNFTGGSADTTTLPHNASALLTVDTCRDATRVRREARARIAAVAPVHTRTAVTRTRVWHPSYCSLDVHADIALAHFAVTENGLELHTVRLSSDEPARCSVWDVEGGAPWSLVWAGGDSPVVCVLGSRLGFMDVSEALSSRSNTPLPFRSFANLTDTGDNFVYASSTVDAAGRCSVTALSSDGTVGAWRVRRNEAATADASLPPFSSEPLLRLEMSGPARADDFSDLGCSQLSSEGTVLAWMAATHERGYAVCVAAVPSTYEQGSWSPIPLALQDVPDDVSALPLAVSTLSFQAAGPTDDAPCGGPLADSLVLGTSLGMCVLPGVLARGASRDVGAVLLNRSDAVFCHQQGVAGQPSLIAYGASNGAVALLDARNPRGVVASWLHRPHASGGAAYCLHACGNYLASGHADGNTRIFDIRRAGDARGPLGLLAASSAVWALHLDEHWLIVSTQDAVVQHSWQ